MVAGFELPLEMVQIRLACPESVLRATTFFHLENKFSQLSSSSLFLRGCLTNCFRYCPLCLQEHAHYSLLWRFSSLKGCTRHGCRLLEQCSHCKRTSVVFRTPLKVGICRICGSDLRRGGVSHLSQEMYEESFASTQDLTFLLSPQVEEALNIDYLKRISQYFTHVRNEKGLSREQVSQDLAVGYSSIVMLEHAFHIHETAPFSHYLNYAKYLGISWPQIFATIFQQTAIDERDQSENIQREHDKLIDQMHSALITLQMQGKPVTEQSICEFVGFPYSTLKKCPDLKAFVKLLAADARGKLRKRRDDAALLKVQRAIEHLEQLGEPVTDLALRNMGFAPASSLFYKGHPQTRAFLKARLEKSNNKKQREDREQLLFAQVQAAIQQLGELGQCVTQHAVSKRVGVSLRCLSSYPSVKSLLQSMAHNYVSFRKSQSQIAEQRLLANVEETIQQLEARGEMTTQRAIGRTLKSAPHMLKRYPRVRQVMEQYPHSFSSEANGTK